MDYDDTMFAPLPIRVDATTIPALIFGSVLIAVAGILAVYVWRVRRDLEPALELDDDARIHADRQLRRRLQVSCMLAVLGVLIPLGDQLDQVFLNQPGLLLIWLLCVLVLVCWMVLMALGDWLSTVAFSAMARARMRLEKRNLEQEIRRFRSSTNGHPLNDMDELS